MLDSVWDLGRIGMTSEKNLVPQSPWEQQLNSVQVNICNSRVKLVSNLCLYVSERTNRWMSRLGGSSYLLHHLSFVPVAFIILSVLLIQSHPLLPPPPAVPWFSCILPSLSSPFLFLPPQFPKKLLPTRVLVCVPAALPLALHFGSTQSPDSRFIPSKTWPLVSTRQSLLSG